MYGEDTYKRKYQFLFNKHESTGLKHLYDCNAFIEYSNDIYGIYVKYWKYNPNKKLKILVVFDDMSADMLSDKKLNSVVTELFIRGRKLNIYLDFIRQSYFVSSKNTRQNCTRYCITKIANKRELQQTAFNHSSDNNFK